MQAFVLDRAGHYEFLCQLVPGARHLTIGASTRRARGQPVGRRGPGQPADREDRLPRRPARAAGRRPPRRRGRLRPRRPGAQPARGRHPRRLRARRSRRLDARASGCCARSCAAAPTHEAQRRRRGGRRRSCARSAERHRLVRRRRLLRLPARPRDHRPRRRAAGRLRHPQGPARAVGRRAVRARRARHRAASSAAARERLRETDARRVRRALDARHRRGVEARRAPRHRRMGQRDRPPLPPPRPVPRRDQPAALRLRRPLRPALLATPPSSCSCASPPTSSPTSRTPCGSPTPRSRAIARLKTVKRAYSQAYWINGTRGRGTDRPRVGPTEYGLATSDPVNDLPRRTQILEAEGGDAWRALERLAARRLGGAPLMAAPALQAAGAALGGRALAPARARRRGRRRCSRLLLLIAAPLALLSSQAAAGRPATSPGLAIPAAFVPVFRRVRARVSASTGYLLASSPSRRPASRPTRPPYHGPQPRRLLRRADSVQPASTAPPSTPGTRHQARLPPRPAPAGYAIRTRRHRTRRSTTTSTPSWPPRSLLREVNGADARLGAAHLPSAVRAYNGAGPDRRQLRRRRPRPRPRWQTHAPPPPATAPRPPTRVRRADLAGATGRSPRRSASAAPGRPATPASTSPSRPARRSSPPRPAASRSSRRPRARAATATTPACSTPRAAAPATPTSSASSSASASIVARGQLDRHLRLHRPLLRPAPALRSPPRRPTRLPRPLPRRGRVQMPRPVHRARAPASASWPGARTPTQQTARATAAAQPARSRPCQQTRRRGQRLLARARASTAPTIDGQRARDAASGRQGVRALWTNWSWRTIGRQQRGSPPLATGPLARQLAAEAQVRVRIRRSRRDRLGAARARRRDRRQTRGRATPPSGLRHMRADRYTDGRADLGGRALPRLPRHRHAHARPAGR